jgi:glycosyltransferase involved in cell wall biosynthesis
MEPVKPMRVGGDEAIVSMIIPCLDEEAAIGPLAGALIAQGVDEVIVVDGGSQDRTCELARAAGAIVVSEPRRGYGRACAAGVAVSRADATIIAFIDGDGSDDPAAAPAIIGPILRGESDFCVATRLAGAREEGSMTPAQVVAGRLAGLLLFLRYGVRYTDMAPFRALRKYHLARLGMAELTYGWNLEMQMRVAALGLRISEVPVRCRRRTGGRSKVSGSWSGTAPAAVNLVLTFLRLAVRSRSHGLT